MPSFMIIQICDLLQAHANSLSGLCSRHSRSHSRVGSHSFCPAADLHAGYLTMSHHCLMMLPSWSCFDDRSLEVRHAPRHAISQDDFREPALQTRMHQLAEENYHSALASHCGHPWMVRMRVLTCHAKWSRHLGGSLQQRRSAKHWSMP